MNVRTRNATRAARHMHTNPPSGTQVDCMRRATLVLCALLWPLSVGAQDTTIVIHPESTNVAIASRQLPRVIADEAIRLFNAPTTTRLFGQTRVPQGNQLWGNVAVLGGPVVVAGRVNGTLLVVNGDLDLEPTAVVDGGVFLVGGTVRAADGAGMNGEVRVYREPLPLRRTGDAIAYWETPRRIFGRFTRASHTWEHAGSSSTLTIATGGTFNRIEGLPIVFGPLLDWRVSRDARWRVDALGIFRTAGNLSAERSDLGFHFKTELRIGEVSQVAFGAHAYDLVEAIERWQLDDAEVGWTAFLLHRDYRDYYLRKGIAAYVRATPDQRLIVTAGVRRDLESSVSARDPWTIFRDDQPWRANPQIDDGHYTTVGAAVTFDTRNDPDDPRAGVLIQASVERSRSTDVVPRALPATIRLPVDTGGPHAFSRAWIDIRAYNRVSPSGRINLRFLTGGWLGGDPLSVQRRLSIGGPDPLPGHVFRSEGCNTGLGDPVEPALCDRVVLFQGEYRGHVSLRWTHDPWGGDDEERSEGQPMVSFEGVDLVVFGNAGQAWL
ncbi:MAG: hypothetical protein ACREN5_11625, partial [Gemmatimonadales bacterium]